MASRIGDLSAARQLSAVVLLVAASACGGGDGPLSGGVASLSLEPSADVKLAAIGQTRELTATPRDEAGNPVSTPVTWSSSNQAVATVSSTGETTAIVTAVAPGTAKIKATAGSRSQEVTVVVQQPQFNVNAELSCLSPDLRSYKVEAQTEHLLIVSGVDNPPGGFTAADYADIAAEFESAVWPVVTANFGAPADMDGNGRVIAFYTRAVNELTKPGDPSVIGGFFFGRDLFPKIAKSGLEGCAGSNEAEMFYMLVPDPTGVVNGNKRELEQVRGLTVGVLAHEFQHLINASRRIYVNTSFPFRWETAYMEEGLSHIAEELVFYEASGLTPRLNIGLSGIQASQSRLAAFNAYMISNAARFSTYLKSPHNNAPYQHDDDLATRGAIWSFLRYLADRGVPGSPVQKSACSEPVALATVGASCMVEGAAAQSFTVPAGGSGGEFAIIAFAKDLAITTTASATSAIAPTGPPNPWTGSGGPLLSMTGSASLAGSEAPLMLDEAFHARLRRMERRELTKHVPAARAAYALRHQVSPRMYAAESTPSVAAVVVEPVWFQLVNLGDTGILNLRGRFGQDISGAAQDWAVAHYVDDVGFAGIPTQHMHPSWNFRTLLPALSSNNDAYPLTVHPLTSAKTFAITDGGAAYYKFGLAAGTTSTVGFTVNNGPPPLNLKLVVVRTK